MAISWAIPKHSKRQVDAAGNVLVSGVKDANTLEVVNNWRSAHAFPLNTMQNNLRRKAENISKRPIVAQRLKRLPSIEGKLARYSSMRLSRMHDIGGCRAVVQTVNQAERLISEYHKAQFRHELVREDNYIESPKASGYRSYHLIYKYHSDRNETYNGMRIEIQIRSSSQHLWATAVETAGMFTSQSLKSSIGNQDWLRFFSLMGSYFAMRERKPAVCNTPEDPRQEIKHYINKLAVIKNLSAFAQIAQYPFPKNNEYVLLQLDMKQETVTLRGFKKSESEDALSAYYKVEEKFRNLDSGDAVLVSVKDINKLRQTYPNYFLDTRSFLRELRRIMI